MADTAGIKTRHTTTEIVETKAEISQKLNFGEYKTIREVVAAVGLLKTRKLIITSNGSLYRALVRIYASLGKRLDLDFKAGGKETERIENELLSAIANMDDAQKWVDLDPNQVETKRELDNRSLNKQDLAKLLDDYEIWLENKENATNISQKLAEKYNVDRSQVEVWILRLEEKRRLFEKQGLSQKVARNVAEKVVIREERLRKDLDRAGVKEDQVKTVASQLVDGQAEAVVSNKDFKVASLKIEGVKLSMEAVAVVEKQARRLENEIKVGQLIEQEQRALVTDLKEEIKISQPGIEFEGHEDRVSELTIQALEKVWGGKYDDLESAEVNVGSRDKPKLVNFKDALVDELKADSGVVTIAVRSGSQQVDNQLKNNIDVAAMHEFVEKSEEIEDTIVGLNPNIDVEIVESYAEEVTRATLPIQSPGNRTVRRISGNYGLNEDAVASANLFFRVSSGMTDYEELEVVSDDLEKAGGDSSIQINAGAETRVSFRFLGELKRNPLLENGLNIVKKQVGRSILTNTTVVEGATSFITNNLGFNTVFGIETATAIPAVMGYFSAGGTFGGAIQGVMQAGGIANWINGLITAGGVAAGATGEIAAGAGATAVVTGTTGGAVVAGAGTAAAAGATVATGGIAAVVIATGVAIKKLVQKGTEILQKIGIDINALNIFSKLKIQAKENLGGLVGGVAGFVLNTADLIIKAVVAAAAMAFAWILKVIAPVAVSVIGGIALYQILVTNPLGSAMAPGRETMGLVGSGLEYDLPFIDVDPVLGEECEMTLACVAMEALLQNGFVRIVPDNVERAGTILRNLIGQYSQFNVARFITEMARSANTYGAFQCIGYSIASDPNLRVPNWQALYAGSSSTGCRAVAPEDAGVGDHIVFPLRNGHYHIGVLVAVREDGSGMMYDVNYDGNGSLHKWPILNIVEFVSGNNQRNPGQHLTVLNCR